MELWSSGLGKRSLRIDCGSEEVGFEKDRVVLSGTVRPPLSWRYRIEMGEEDWLGFFETAVHPVVVRYLARPKRWGLALRASRHLTAFLAVYAVHLLLPARATRAPAPARGAERTPAPYTPDRRPPG